MTNTGKSTLPHDIRLNVGYGNQTLESHDLLGGFREESYSHPGRVTLRGPAPGLNGPRLVAWYRFAPPSAEVYHPPEVSQVEVIR